MFSSLGLSLMVLAFSFALGPKAFSCASCGSGGDDPMILYPNETNKIFVGSTSISGFRNIGPSGELVSAGGPTRKFTQTLAYGRGFSPRAFATVTWPMVTNLRNQDSRSGSGDPTLSARYAFLLQSIAEPWLPQIQGIIGGKTGFATSLRNSEEPKTLLDVFGTGFPELRGGVDIWYGMSPTLCGFAHIVSYPLSRSYDAMLFQPGITHRSTLTLGYRWTTHVKTLVGTNRESHDPIKVDDAVSPDSDQLNFSTFFTQDFMFDALSMIRLSLSQQGAYGPVRNSAKSSSVMLAYMKSF